MHANEPSGRQVLLELAWTICQRGRGQSGEAAVRASLEAIQLDPAGPSAAGVHVPVRGEARTVAPGLRAGWPCGARADSQRDVGSVPAQVEKVKDLLVQVCAHSHTKLVAATVLTRAIQRVQQATRRIYVTQAMWRAHGAQAHGRDSGTRLRNADRVQAVRSPDCAARYVSWHS
jgi:hypothetical protein